MNQHSQGLRSIFRATAILSASSVVTIILGLVTSKVNAVFLGPSGYGYFGLLQSMVNLTALLAGLGVGSGLVRMGASRVAQNDLQGIANLWHGAKLILNVSCCLVLILVFVFRRTLSIWFLGTPDHPWSVALMGLVIVLTISAGLKTNIINAYHRVGALAANSAVVALLGAIVCIILVIVWGEKGIVPSLIMVGFLTWAVATMVYRREVGQLPARSSHKDSLRAAGSLLTFGVPFTASAIVGTGVQLALPILVLHTLGAEDVGYYRAAVAVSVTYLGFLITAMAQDYFPRVAAVTNDPEKLCELINKQQRLIVLVGIPMILGTLALVPILVPLVYSLKFAPTVEILEWQLIGDIFKFSSWTMAYVILASCSSVTYFSVELVGGVTAVVSTWLAVKWFGIAGLGISFVITYILYYLLVWIVVRRKIGFKPKQNIALIGALVAGLLLKLLSYSSLRAYRSPVGMILAFASAVWSFIAIAREMGDFKVLLPFQRIVIRVSDSVIARISGI